MNNQAVKLILVLCLVILASCSQEHKQSVPYEAPSTHKNPLVMIVKQRSDSASIDITNNLTQTLNYTKIPFLTFDSDLLSTSFSIPASVRVLCITATEVESFTDKQFQSILSFVGRGNTLFLTGPVFEERFNFLNGIKNDEDYAIAKKSNGFKFHKPIFPGYDAHTFELKTSYRHEGIIKTAFKKDIEIIASSDDSTHTPVITKNEVGDGQVYMFNSINGFDKLYHGMLFSIMLPSFQDIPYPVADVSTIFLDDFPLPLYQEKEPPIDQEYDMTEGDFIAKIWWPDMKALADSFNIDYTALLAFNYNANVVPPFDFNEWRSSTITKNGQKINGSIWLARQVKDSRHELGFHGYNHISLWQKDWLSQSFMISALQAARKRWRIDQLGHLPVTYVPPNNDIDSVGIRALAEEMPNIKYLSSLYFGDIASGGGREFGPDPYAPSMFDYPRISSGYEIKGGKRFDFQSLYLVTGIWTHFVHPDDVFEIEESRNERGLGWKKSKTHDYGLYQLFKNDLRDIQQTYPLARFLSAREAVPKVKAWRQLNLRRGANETYTYATKANPENDTDYWFIYTDSAHADTLKTYLEKESETYHFTPVWNGYLVQFKSEKDSLYFPNFWRGKNDTTELNRVQHNFAAYMKAENEQSPEQSWQDTRLQDARAALRQNPDSKKQQERVINLAIEFDRVPLAIDILEKRLLNNPTWQQDDADQLLKYYGWQSESSEAYDFLERLWDKYHSRSVHNLKDQMVQRYGIPNEDFQNKWLSRAVQLNPNDQQTLQKYITRRQSEEAWPQTKKYLQRLIQQHPRSDSLYYYTLQRSFYYDQPQQTLNMLANFPDDADPQLHPLAPQIADLYAYTSQNYTKALQWADQIPDFPTQTKLEWLLQQKRYTAFLKRSDKALKQQPQNDSLRTFIGRQLIYEGFYDKGYARLYPLFEKRQTQKSTQKLVHTEIGYQPYAQQKQFYQKYPAFFSDSLHAALQQSYRTNEGFQAGLTADYASDNFNNTTARLGGFAEWGNRQKYTHYIVAEETAVSSDTAGNNPKTLTHLAYRYRLIRPEKSARLDFTGGLYYGGSRLRPQAQIHFGRGVDSSFTSLQLGIDPVFTTTAINRHYSKIELEAYREDYWFSSRLQTAGSFTGRRYSNNIYFYEALGRLYQKMPFSTAHSRIRSIQELSYSDASTSYSSGVPYYTPNQMLVEGIGAGYRYRDERQNPAFSLALEIMAKHDNKDGFFGASSLSLNARLHRYWQLSLDADISTSAVYRYNHVGLTLSYLFPRHL